jgi:CBS domain-containing protein
MRPEMVPPLDALPREAAEAFLSQGKELVVPAETVLLKAGERPAEHLYLVLEGEVALLRGQARVGTLGPGEFFGFPSLLSGEPPTFTVKAKTQARLLVFPREAFQRLMTFHEAARFFSKGLVQRIQLETVPEPSLFTPLGQLVRRPPVFISPAATVKEAAQKMRAERISSLLVEGEPLGILTDRDLRNRVVAEGRPSATPVAEVMSAPLFTLPAETPVYEALAVMVERGIHHLPVTQGKAIMGVITHSDLVLYQSQSPLVLLRRIERLDLRQYSLEVARLARNLLESGLPPSGIGRVVAGLNDALIRRLVKEAEARLGPPPHPL